MEEAEILLRNAMEHHGAAVYRLALCPDAERPGRRGRVPGRVSPAAGPGGICLGRGASAGLAAAVHGEPVP